MGTSPSVQVINSQKRSKNFQTFENFLQQSTVDTHFLHGQAKSFQTFLQQSTVDTHFLRGRAKSFKTFENFFTKLSAKGKK